MGASGAKFKLSSEKIGCGNWVRGGGGKGSRALWLSDDKTTQHTTTTPLQPDFNLSQGSGNPNYDILQKHCNALAFASAMNAADLAIEFWVLASNHVSLRCRKEKAPVGDFARAWNQESGSNGLPIQGESILKHGSIEIRCP